jgi:hypothetical protein
MPFAIEDAFLHTLLRMALGTKNNGLIKIKLFG